MKDLPQQRILAQNYGRGYECLYQIVAVDHHINSSCLAMMVWSPFVQLSLQNLSQYFIKYVDHMTMCGFLQTIPQI